MRTLFRIRNQLLCMLASEVLLELKDRSALVVLMATKAKRVRRARLVLLETKDLEDRRAFKGRKVLLGLLVPLAIR